MLQQGKEMPHFGRAAAFAFVLALAAICVGLAPAANTYFGIGPAVEKLYAKMQANFRGVCLGHPHWCEHKKRKV